MRTAAGSLINKLMLLYALVTAGIIILVCLFLFPTFEKVTHFSHEVRAHHLWDECIIKLMIALSLSLLGAILCGKSIAHYVIKQIQAIAHKMEHINFNSLDEQLNLENLPLELQPLAESFNTMLVRLHRAYQQLAQFSADISHELRNSLHHLTMSAELVLAREHAKEEYRQLLESHMEEYHHLAKVIENLLFLARSDHGQTSLDKKMLCARDEVIKIFAYHQPLADEKNIQLRCEGDAFIKADVILFKRAINNLLSNAIKYTRSSGTVSVNIQTTTTSVAITVADSGVGIPQDHLGKIFTRFYRVDSSHFEQTPGLGLGLAIVKSIVELHRGSIAVSSVINSGTTVLLEFPV